MTFRAEGWHRWPDAPATRAYLAHPHRHMFGVRVELGVSHDERDVEFHDLIDFCRETFGQGVDHGPESCETMARSLLAAILETYGTDRRCRVTVDEDGEAGATVAYHP